MAYFEPRVAELGQYQVERGPPHQTVWIAEGLRQFKVVVVLSNKQLHRIFGGFDRGGKFAVLALELRGLAGAVRDNKGRV
jgi:hypothetical protein